MIATTSQQTGSQMLTKSSRATANLTNNEATYDTQRVRTRLKSAQLTQEFKELKKEMPQLANLSGDDDPETNAPMGGGGGGGGTVANEVTAKAQQAKLDKRALWRRIVIIAAIALVLWYVFRKQTTN